MSSVLDPPVMIFKITSIFYQSESLSLDERLRNVCQHIAAVNHLETNVASVKIELHYMKLEKSNVA